MSQKATRKSQNATTTSEEKEKVDTPVKEMKKKMAANAEKDKQAAEKPDKPVEKSDKNDADKSKSDKPDKNGDKAETQKDKPADKKTDAKDKPADKKADAKDKPADKKADAKDKPADKKTDGKDKPADRNTDAKDKPADKQEKVAEKKQDKTEKLAEKKDAPTEKDDKADKTKEKPSKAVNGHNGAVSNGDNGTVSDDSDVELVLDEDELFPELTYDDSGTDADEAPPSRSLTRRSQVKATNTPETPAPRPASDSQSDDSKESKVLKLTDPVTSDRKLRSADSPKPEAKKAEKKAQDSPKKQDSDATKKQDSEADKKEQKDGGEKGDKMEVEFVVEVQTSEGSTPRTRARVSPYSRTRLDRTLTSVMADYTGNNSTMEMDITECSLVEEGSPNDSAYLRGLRGIRGRSSYKQLKELTLTNPNAGKPRPPPTVPIRPLGAVVGRKRKPSPSPPASPPVERGVEACESTAASKRMKLLDRLAAPWRRSLTSRAADIVGINTDLPLTAPVASTSFASFDPETIKPTPTVSPGEPVATPLPTPLTTMQDRDGKRCIVM